MGGGCGCEAMGGCHDFVHRLAPRRPGSVTRSTPSRTICCAPRGRALPTQRRPPRRAVVPVRSSSSSSSCAGNAGLQGGDVGADLLGTRGLGIRDARGGCVSVALPKTPPGFPLFFFSFFSRAGGSGEDLSSLDAMQRKIAALEARLDGRSLPPPPSSANRVRESDWRSL